MSPALQGLITIAIGVGGCVAYFYFSNVILDKVIFPPRGPHAGRNINRAGMIRPWLFLAPALAALGLYLAYPVFETLRLSLTDRVPLPSAPGKFQYVWAGLDNYRQMSREAKFWEAMRNNMMWLFVVPAAATGFGLLVAQLTDRIRWGAIAKSLIFMPMAISFVGASVIFKLVYEMRGADQEQIGVLNALWLRFDGGFGSQLLFRFMPLVVLVTFGALVLWIVWLLMRGIGRAGPWSRLARAGASVFGLYMVWVAVTNLAGVASAELPYGTPQAWIALPYWNNFFLMVVLIWIQTGFAMVILSAALRGIPEETVEAAIVDGANPFQIFFQIKVPQIAGTIVVVWTTITITVLKVFDIVFAMTNGQWQTQVLANYMYEKLFVTADWGVGSASAMVIMLLVSPILVWNVINARREMR